MTHKILYESLFKSAEKLVPLGWYQWDLNENNIIFSDEFSHIFGLSPKISFGDFMDKLSPQSQNTFKTMHSKIKKSNHLDAFSFEIVDQNKQIHWIKMNGLVTSDSQSQTYKVVGSIIDITKKHKHERMLNLEIDFYEALMGTLENPIFYKNKQGIYTYCNQAFCEYIGLPYDEIIGNSIDIFAGNGDVKLNIEMDEQLFRTKEKVVYETFMVKGDGAFRNVIINKTLHQDEGGKLLGVVGLIYDITDSKRNQTLIQKQVHIKDVIINISQNIQEFVDEADLYTNLIEQLLLVFENAHSGSILDVTENNTLVIQASCNYDAIVTESFEIPLKESFVYHDAKGKIEKPGIINQVDDLMEEYDFPERIKNDKDDVLRSNLYIPMIINNKLLKIISLDSNRSFNFTSFDLTIAEYIQEQINIIHKLFQLYQQTIKLSRYDNLTGVMNRGYFEAILEDRLELALRNDYSFSIIVFDLDNLKYVNDTYGHNVGDQYIKRFTDLLSKYFRATDQIGRLGGDEFACSFIESNIASVITKVESLRLEIQERPFGDELHPFNGRFSYGVASLPIDGLTVYDLIKKADFDMYVDKKQYKEKHHNNDNE